MDFNLHRYIIIRGHLFFFALLRRNLREDVLADEVVEKFTKYRVFIRRQLSLSYKANNALLLNGFPLSVEHFLIVLVVLAHDLVVFKPVLDYFDQQTLLFLLYFFKGTLQKELDLGRFLALLQPLLGQNFWVVFSDGGQNLNFVLGGIVIYLEHRVD